jgi:basic amino acid/polyamine antiporter, APA family
VIAILVTSSVALVLAVSGRYRELALASAISRLLVYVATCASTLRLRGSHAVPPPNFVVPFGPLIPASAIAIALAMVAGARRDQLIAGVAALLAGAVLYVIAATGTKPGIKRRGVQLSQ